ncbi:MAG: aspartate kinase [Clostridia bacterium]|nr:aspartate kinase [Clostridia bacterium]
MIKVCKFGGSSVANGDQYRKIKEIVDSDKERKIIVASACGKSGKNDHKVTDLLYLCDAHVKYGMDYDDILSLILKKHQGIKEDLGLKLDVEAEVGKIREILENKGSIDELVSRGEYLSCKLLAEYLDADFVDAKDVVTFRYDGSLDIEKTKEKFAPHLSGKRKIVVPGFYGALPNGKIKVMSRGGSDISGALLANIADASVYENWTDVSGILVTDPRIIQNPKKIKYITYAELRELSYMGANVLHDEAIFPVKEKNIPINIRNTNDKDEPGTMIVNEVTSKEETPLVTGIAGKKGFTVISAGKSNISNEIGFLKRALQIIENHRIPVTTVTTGVDNFSLIMSADDVKDNIYEIMNAFRTELQCDDVNIYENLALVCIVGRGMKARTGMSGEIFGELGRKKVNIKTISQGSDEISIIVGISDKDFKKAIEAVYNRFIAE